MANETRRRTLILDCIERRAAAPLSLHDASYILQRSVAEIKDSVRMHGKHAGIVTGDVVTGVHRSWILSQLPASELLAATTRPSKEVRARFSW